MATKQVEIAGYPGLTTATAVVRTDSAGDPLGTGTADSVALVLQDGHTDLYWAVITYTGDELLGDWSVKAGVVNTLVKFAAGVDTYSLTGDDGASLVGSGAVEHPITVTKDGLPVDGAEVWITSDEDGLVVVAGTLDTDTFGNTPDFMLDPGTYYVWVQKSGVNFTNPTEIELEEP